MPHINVICGAGYVSGKEIMALELSAGLRKHGRSVEFVISSWNNGDFRRRLAAVGASYTELPIGFISATLTLDCLRMTTEQMVRWPGLLLDYGRMLQRRNPSQVVHTNWHHLLLMWPVLKPDRDIYWVHEIIPEKFRYRRFFGAMERRLKCFVSVSHAVADSLRRLGVSEGKIRVIHNGMRKPEFVAAPGVKVSNTFRIGVVGQVGAWKGHEDLLAAFHLLVRDRLDVELHIFGMGTQDYESELKRRAEELGVSSRVAWHGFVTNRDDIFSTMDICVVPSRFEEPFGLVAMEAAFFGLPVVASRRGGLAEIVQHGITGFLVEAERPRELAARLRELVQSPSMRVNMGGQAQQRATTLFSVERFLKEFESVLDSAPGE